MPKDPQSLPLNEAQLGVLHGIPAVDQAGFVSRLYDRSESQAMVQLPKYKSHKEVWALKIKNIDLDSVKAQAESRETDGSAIITPEESGFAPFRVGFDYVRKHQPKAGGYYVRYEDGYESWSPAGVFEAGYTRI